MLLKNRINKYLPNLSDVETIDAHRKVIESINMLKELIPDGFNQYNIINIILPKAYDYHTSLNNIFYAYRHITYLLKKLFLLEKIAGALSYKLIKIKKSKFIENIRSNKDELSINFYNNNELDDKNYYENSYNLFSASTQTYLRVLTLYIKQSNCDNNLLVVPRHLKDVAIL